MNTHTLSVLVENKPGVLARIAGLFARRGYNIESLAVGPTENEEFSRITVQVAVDSQLVLEQIVKQLNKLVDVIKVQEYAEGDSLERELVLAKVHTGAQTRSEVMQIVSIFRGKIVDVGHEFVTVELTGTEDKVEAMLGLLKPFGIREVVRTGTIAIARK